MPVRVGVPGAIDPNNPDGRDPDDENDENGEDAEGSGGPEDSPPQAGTPDGNVGLGPIRGVRSRSKEDSIKVMFGQKRYDQWQFTVELLAGGGTIQEGAPGFPGPAGTRTSARWIGRPFRTGMQQPGAPNERQVKP